MRPRRRRIAVVVVSAAALWVAAGAPGGLNLTSLLGL